MASLPPPPGGPGWAPAPARGAEPSRWTARIALLVAFLACIIGVVGWFRPLTPPSPDEPEPVYTAAEVQAAKDKVCAAFDEAWKAISVTSRAEAGEDVALRFAYSANARLAMSATSAYLESQLSPAVTEELALRAGEFSRALLKMSILTLGGDTKADESYQSAKEDVMADKESLSEACAEQ